jgi:glycosidase
MQWNSEPNAGFSAAKPWLPVPKSFKTHNVQIETAKPDSILNFYKQLIALHRTNAALRDGEYVPLNEQDPNVLSYLRRSGDRSVLVALNLSSSAQDVSFDLEPGAVLLTSTGKRSQNNLKQLRLDPFGVFVAEVK